MTMTMATGGLPALKIGTRGSPLALAQAYEVQALLTRGQERGDAPPEIVIIKTTGDAIQDRPLSEAGGKGLFTKEIDTAMLAGEIDLAVHSSKDLPTKLPDGIELVGYLEREDPRDAFISIRAAGLAQLPRGATLGTASLRRQALAKRLRPDLDVRLLRGNVESRLRKAESGEFDATLLAYAGLKRLGLAHRVTSLLSVEEFLPAVGQGAIGLTIRTNDDRAREMASSILDEVTGAAVETERAFLLELDGSCRTPIAGYASVSAGEIRFRGMVLSPDGARAFETSATGPVADGRKMGRDAGDRAIGSTPAPLSRHFLKRLLENPDGALQRLPHPPNNRRADRDPRQCCHDGELTVEPDGL